MYLIIVTGLSGAGKSQALKCFEDMGYFCVDNLPCEMLPGFIRLCDKASPSVKRAAVVMDSRENVFRSNSRTISDMLLGSRMKYDIVFFDCRDEILERRYNETRRRHPLSADIREGIRLERELLMGLRDRADYIIDTTDMRPLELNARLLELFADGAGVDFLLTFESFGYKRGLPVEADMIFDVRFSPNPFYEPDLRALSGTDAEVRAFIMADEDFVFMLDKLEEILNRLIGKFIEQGKRRLLVAFGCTGGRHRSVCAAEAMYARMNGRYHTSIIHRDLNVEGDEIKARSGKQVD